MTEGETGNGRHKFKPDSTTDLNKTYYLVWALVFSTSVEAERKETLFWSIPVLWQALDHALSHLISANHHEGIIGPIQTHKESRTGMVFSNFSKLSLVKVEMTLNSGLSDYGSFYGSMLLNLRMKDSLKRMKTFPVLG